MLRKCSRGNGEGGNSRKRPDGRWEAKYTAGWTADGQQVRKSVYGLTRAECAEKLKKGLAATTQGAVVLARQNKLTLAGYLCLPQGPQSRGRREHHFKEGRYVRLMKKRTVCGTSLIELRPARLEGFHRKLATTHAPSTVRHLRSFINKALRQAMRHDVLPTHVGLIAERPRMQRESVARAVEPEELTRIVQHARNTQHHVLIVTIAVLGVRYSEALGFQ